LQLFTTEVKKKKEKNAAFYMQILPVKTTGKNIFIFPNI
jgi:hypothetical protein